MAEASGVDAESIEVAFALPLRDRDALEADSGQGSI
jgi:hypothetical protein